MACPFGQGAVNDHEGGESLGGPGGVYYKEYLQLDGLLKAQKPLTQAHDEMLFIVTHQAYELWFKQMLHELRSVQEVFLQPPVSERHMLLVTSRLNRVSEILRLLVQQFQVLETMTAMDFLEFRDTLIPASGFQSLQFRELEFLLGASSHIRPDHRHDARAHAFYSHFQTLDADGLKEKSNQQSLFSLVERWLERTPGLHDGHVQHSSKCYDSDGDTNNNDNATEKPFCFWCAYQQAVARMIADRRKAIRADVLEGVRKSLQADCDKLEASYGVLFDESEYANSVASGARRMSLKATQGALLIMLYRDEPLFNVPFEMLQKLMDIDEHLSKWRYQHLMMVQRMIGSRVGTGGSSGEGYLRSTLGSKHRAFSDLFSLSNYYLPRSHLPALPEGLRTRLSRFLR